MALAGGKRQLMFQIIRFGINGGLVTAWQAAVYAGAQRLGHLTPTISYYISYVAAVIVGYGLHSRITFKGHGERGLASVVKFVIGSLPSGLLNLFWTWFFTTHMHWAWWTPLVPLFLITPIMIFALNRWWVFK